MEYLIVQFPEMRGVLVDGAFEGWTNTVLQLDAGEHDVELMPPRNFSPVSQHVCLQHTAPLDPYRITFHRLPASAIPPSPGSST